MNHHQSQPIHRRTVLRAAGVCLSLPFLESLPGLQAQEPKAGVQKSIPRMVFIYNPNGCANEHWHPKDTGPNYTLSKTISAMKEWRRHMTVLSGPAHTPSTNAHASVSRMLSCYSQSDRPNTPVQRQSLDQLAAETLTNVTRFPSLQIACEPGVGPINNSRTMAFDKSGRGLPAIRDPRQLFNRLFSSPDATGKAQAEHRYQTKRSVLDGIRKQFAHLNRKNRSRRSTTFESISRHRS